MLAPSNWLWVWWGEIRVTVVLTEQAKNWCAGNQRPWALELSVNFLGNGLTKGIHLIWHFRCPLVIQFVTSSKRDAGVYRQIIDFVRGDKKSLFFPLSKNLFVFVFSKRSHKIIADVLDSGFALREISFHCIRNECFCVTKGMDDVLYFIPHFPFSSGRTV